MTGARPWRGGRRAVTLVVALVVAVLPLLGGCAAGAGGNLSSAGPEDTVVALRVAAAAREPVWSHEAAAIVALTEDGSRLESIGPSVRPGAPPNARSTLSAPLRDVGENIAVDPVDDAVVFLPQPRLGRVAAVRAADLRQVGTLRAGPSPSLLSVDSGSRHLLALSADGSTVTPVNLHDDTVNPSNHVHAGPEAELDGAKRGRLIDYHVTGPAGIAHYAGYPGAVHKTGEIAVRAGETAGDLVKSSRLYVAETGTDRLLAVDTTRHLLGLQVVGHASLDEPVHYLGADETRIYAATQRELIVLETNSFVGYRGGNIPILATIDYRAPLQGALRSAPLSGLVVGPHRVYLTVQGQPFVISVNKPSA